MHPFPLLARDGWIDLCGQWRFAVDDADRGLAEHWYRSPEFARSIEVPFPPECAASGIHDVRLHPVVWYAREFQAAVDADRLILHVGACDYSARVWCNGIQVAAHEGGSTPFTADLTDALRADGPQTLVIRAMDDATDPYQPRGKQDWQERPHEIWYERTTGIWQPVWLEWVPDVHITDLHWTTDLAAGTVTCAVELSKSVRTRMHLRLTLDGRELADVDCALDGRAGAVAIALPDLANKQAARALYWDPDHPVLIDAEVSVGGDRVSSYVGIREIGTQDGRVLLNQRPYFLRMALDQGYWPDSHLALPSLDSARDRIQLAKDLGFNGVRLHQKLDDPRLLYWCDRLGVLTWVEMPSAYGFSASSVERVTTEWLAAVRRYRNNPSVMAWVPFNESWGAQFLAGRADQRAMVEALYHLTKAQDPTRPVIGNDGWEQPVGDLITVHDYSHVADVLRARYGDRTAVTETIRDGWPSVRRLLLDARSVADRPVVLSEFGGLSLGRASQDEFTYAALPDAEQFERLLRELFAAVHDSSALAGFCYTQLADTRQERNGLLDERLRPKLPIETPRAIVSGAQP